jgi:hypothetical protein
VAASKPKAAYTSDQRQLSVLIAASRTGGTTYSVVWRECLAGETAMREHVVLKGKWKPTLSVEPEAIEALKWIAMALYRAQEAAEK